MIKNLNPISFYRGVIFDFDCTLVDSKPGMFRCINQVLEQMGYLPASFSEVIQTIGYPPEEKFTQLTQNANVSERNHFKALYTTLINPPHSALLQDTKPFPGTIKLLQFLQKHNCKIGIVSTKATQALLAEINHLHLSAYIDDICALEDVAHPKPNPEGISRMLMHWGYEPQDVLYIGDHHVDAAAAEAAGVPYIGVTTGSTTRDQLTAYPNLCIVDTLDAILERWVE